MSADDEIVVEYSVDIPADAERGDTLSIEGEFGSGDVEQSTAASTIEVRGPLFEGVVSDYNTDGDDDIDIQELGSAAAAYASGRG